MVTPRSRFVLLLPTALALVGCPSGSTPVPAPPETDPCTALTGRADSARDTVVIVVDRLDPRAGAVPQTAGEALVFRHLYHRLVEVDCEGRVAPGLASEWRAEADGARWVVVLRDDATFWDGSPVRAADVVASWRRTGAQTGSVTPLDDRTVVLALGFAVPHLPQVLAGRGLVVARPDTGSRWLIGTGAFRPTPSPGPLVLRPVRGTGPVLRFLERRGVDPRDILDQGAADAMMIRNREALAYAASREDLVRVPLAWSTSYVLLSSSDWLPTAADST